MDRSLSRALLLVSLVACGGSTPAASSDPSAVPASSSQSGAHQGAGHAAHADFPACTTLAKTCHAHDKDSDKAHACHVLGHSASSNEECEAKRAECLAICGGDGGA